VTLRHLSLLFVKLHESVLRLVAARLSDYCARWGRLKVILCSPELVASSGRRRLAIVAAGFVLAGAPPALVVTGERKPGAESFTDECKGKLSNRK
jgi:hypothetical protein